MKRWILLAAGLSAAVVIVAAAYRWKDIAAQFHLNSLVADPSLADSFLEESPDSPKGRAVRRYYLGRKEDCLRKLIETIREVSGTDSGLKDLEAMGSGVLGLDRSLRYAREIIPWYEYERRDGSAGARAVNFGQSVFDDRLRSFFAILVETRWEGVTLEEHPGLRFDTFRGEGKYIKGWWDPPDDQAEHVGIRFHRSDPVPPEAEVSMGASVWTGKDLLVLGSPNGAALDPGSGRWRTVRGPPGATSSPECAVWLGAGKVLSARKAGPKRIIFDRYLAYADRWEKAGEAGPEVFVGPEEIHENAEIWIHGGVKVDRDAIVFVQSNYSGCPARGLRVDASGRVRSISTKGAPSGSAGSMAIYAFGRRIFLWGYETIVKNSGAIWDAERDVWEPLPETERSAHPRYSFGHCATADEVMIFGGAFSSAFGWIIDDGLIYSMRENAWRPLPLAPPLAGRRDFAMVWTGKEVVMWGGDQASPADPSVPGYVHAASGILLDPRTGAWRSLPAQGGPGPRLPSISAWTGKEVLLVGGSDYPRYFNEAWALDPEKGTWRRLEDFPRRAGSAARR